MLRKYVYGIKINLCKHLRLRQYSFLNRFTRYSKTHNYGTSYGTIQFLWHIENTFYQNFNVFNKYIILYSIVISLLHKDMQKPLK